MKTEGTGDGKQMNVPTGSIKRFQCLLKGIVLLAILALILEVPLAAQYILQDEDVVVSDGIIESCSYDFSIKEIIIPDTLDGQAIRGIADGNTGMKEYCEGVFSEKGLREVVFPSTLELIGNCAFAFNNLIRLDLSVCSGLSSIGDMAFWYNNQLTELDLSTSSALKQIGMYAFAESSIADINFSGCVALEHIGYEAFSWSAITHLDFSDCASLRVIGDHAFSYNAVDTINFSGALALKEIGSGAFKDCHLSTLDLSGCPALISIHSHAFVGNPIRLLNLNGCTSLRTLGESAFYNTELANLDLQGCPALAEIGNGAFSRNSISSVDFSGSLHLRSIGNYAFSNNELDSIDLAGCVSLEKIGKGSFMGNSSLDSVVLPVNLDHEALGWKDLLGNGYAGGDGVTDFSTTYYVPIPYTLTADDFSHEGITGFCTYDFQYTDVIIPDTLGGDTVSYIGRPGAGNGVFYDKPVTSVILPSTLETLGPYAFRANKQLRSLDLSSCKNLEAIQANAIVENAIDQLDLESCSSLAIIGTYAFRENELSSIDLSSCHSLTTIGRGAFESNLMTVFRLPENTEYPDYGWKDAHGQAYAGGDTVMDFSLFYYVPVPYTLKDTDVVMSNGFLETCSYDFRLRELIIPDTLDGQAVTGIGGWGWGERMVFGKHGIVSVQLPATVESIGETAFYNNELSSIDLKNCTRLVSIGLNAFILNQMQSFTLPKPDVPGHQFNYWVDGEGKVYEGGDSVHNLFTSYEAVLTTLFTATFHITAGGDPISGAELTLAGYETVKSNSDGVATIRDIIPADSLTYSIKAEGYEEASGTISVVDSHVVEHVTLTGLTDLAQKKSIPFHLYPNPAKDYIRVEVAEQSHLRIRDLSGKLLVSQELSPGISTILTDQLKPGSYLVKVRSKNGDFESTLMIH